MAPVVHGLEQQWGADIDFVYLDIDDSQNDVFKRTFGFTYQPLYILLDSAGQIVERWFGVVEASAFESAFQQVVP
jgi:hypothetical protein